MKKLLLSILFVLSLQWANALEVVITTDEFVSILKNSKEVVIIDCDRPQNYANSHVKRAINIWQQDLFASKPDGVLKSPEELAKFFGSKGVSEKAPILLYDDGSNKYTSRLYFILKMLGAQDVKIVTKNDSEWAKYRIALNAQPTTLPKTTFQLNLNPDMMLAMDVFKNKLQEGGLVLIDTRKPEEYQGKTDKSKGHIPGAIHIEYKLFLDAKNNFKNPEELRSIPEIASLDPEKEIVLYCNSGVLASVGYIALKEILGFQKVKVLDGGFNHWALDPNNPVSTE